MLAVLVTLAVLICGGGAALYYLRSQDGSSPSTAATSPAPGDPPTAAPQPSAEPTSTEPTVESSTDPRFVKAGQCVRNVGPANGQPKLVIAPCGAGTYQVLRRFDGATSGEKDAEAKCAKVEGYTNWYFFNSPLDTLDFVLCLKSR
ncbi:LppU/SCO3897 family protein [Micromonospora echinofusca]|uniref:LppU/SCO3897 family protein n=1 Tax=Micromonospora echinofusca TaxID=47858 RepID=UPI001FCE153F|nr:hypothetical protein [Micromonospora echinofusca]